MAVNSGLSAFRCCFKSRYYILPSVSVESPWKLDKRDSLAGFSLGFRTMMLMMVMMTLMILMNTTVMMLKIVVAIVIEQ